VSFKNGKGVSGTFGGSGRAIGTAPFGGKAVALETAQGTNLGPHRMHARRPVLDARHMQEPAIKINLILPECAQLPRPQPVPVRNRYHRRVAPPYRPCSRAAVVRSPTSLTVGYSRGRRLLYAIRRGGTVPFT